MIETIVFDLGGVLIDWNPRYVFRQIFETEEEIDWFLTEICDSDWNEEQDAGRPLKEATALKVLEFPQHRDAIQAYYGRWEEMLGGAIEGTVEIFRNLKSSGQYQILALTNWSHETFPVAQERFEFLQWFDGIVVSGVEKTRKPKKEIYNILLHRYKVTAEKSVFIDDNKRNIDAAVQLGINGILYENSHQLRSELQSMGITF